MIPIYEQKDKMGEGLTQEDFIKRFEEICNNKKTKSFALFFRDFNDTKTQEVMKNQKVFSCLDELTGNGISLFFLHSGNKHSIQKFNNHFLKTVLDIQDNDFSFPCIVFFKFKNGEIHDIQIANIEGGLITAFQEIYTIIETYKKGTSYNSKNALIRYVSKGYETVIKTATLLNAFREIKNLFYS